MKKSTTFLLIVAFIISIFFVSTMGVAAYNSHMKSYFKDVEIINCQTIKQPGGVYKYDRVTFNPDGDTIYKIDYKLTPDQSKVTEQDAFEFIFDDDGGSHVVIENGEPKNSPNAILNKNIVTFLYIDPEKKSTSVTVRLQTLDGSNKYDTISIICMAPDL